ncbi:MAG: YdcF family protein [Planctomycetaceae bacterium]|nr:YdcF family protein [Planctomycetaceae bacterium]
MPGDETLRPLVGAALVKVGMAREVLVPATRVSADEKDGISQPTSEIVRRILLHRGIPEMKIVSLNCANRTTFDDARALAEFLESKPLDTVIVITNAFHTRRTRYIFREVLGSKADRLRFVAAPNPGFADDNWWQQRTGIRIVLSENIKLFFYFLRYGDFLIWVVGGGGLLTGGMWVWRRCKHTQGMAHVNDS